MTDWPTARIFSSPGWISGMSSLIGMNTSAPASAAWPTTNKAFFLPFRVATPTIACKMAFGCGVTAGSSVDLGIYDPQGNRIVSTGGQARVASSEVITDITDTYLPTGLYYMAAACNGTANVIAWVPSGSSPVPLQKARIMGVMEMATAYVLPDPVTFAAISAAFVPAVAIYTRPY